MQVLPETHTLATLDPHTLHMELPYESRQSLLDSLAHRTDSRAAELYAHESRHFQDLVGTLWGQDYLDILFAAYDSILTWPDSESKFPALLSLFDTDRSILFPSYYKYVISGAPHGSAADPWSMAFSSGVRIRADGRSDEGQPILFVRFDKRDDHVARQPVTVGSLLEMRALGCEVGAWSLWNGTRPADEQKVNEVLKGRELLKHFYDPRMTTYSVASHIAAQFLHNPDVIAMTDAGFKLSELAFNLTGNEFGRLVHPGDLFAALGRNRLRGFKAQRDRGYAYTVLMWYLRGLPCDLVTEEAVEIVLKRAGLRSIDDIIIAARTAIERKRAIKLANPDLRRLRERLIDAGLALLGRRNFSALALKPLQGALPAPLVMTGDDCAEFHVGPPALTVDESQFLHDCYSRLRDETRLALRAARGFEFGWTDFIY
jgi:hypothetical protein